MKEEIKELVVDDDELIAYYKDGSFQTFDTLTEDVLDCITNLQEENEELKKENEKLTQLWLNSQEKRRKAIEIIEYYGITPDQNDDMTCRSILNQLFNILKGDKDE